jgi:hypothetical protein
MQYRRVECAPPSNMEVGGLWRRRVEALLMRVSAWDVQTGAQLYNRSRTKHFYG